MSVQLYLTNPDTPFGEPGHRHTEWLDVANGDHKRFAREVLALLPYEQRDFGEFEWVVRPINFPVWRAAIKTYKLCNAELFHKMLDLLEADDRYWLEISQ